MLNKRFATGLLLVSSICGLIEAAPAMAQSALAQQSAAQQSTAQPSTKSSTAKPAAKPAAKPTAVPAKKSAPKPLVYVMDNRSSNKSADAKSADANKTADATSSKPAASVKNASATSASKTSPAAAPTVKPLSADLTKAFQQNCPSVALTDSKSKAAYDVMFERDPGSKGVKSAFGLHKASKIEVMSKTGKELFSEAGHSTGQLVKDACTAIGTPGTKIAKN
jgi:DNA polymerase III gamma/tau subunit